MGITGLIPFLEKSSRQIKISQFSGCTVAIDAYCYLHKGAFSCADKLARGDKTDVYVNYSMKYVNMLLSHNIKPILVFDGRHLPAKAGTEKKRRQNREMNRRRAAELLRQDKPSEARSFLQRCVDVTHEMAVELMRACRARGVDCITAPYEADAQLAYLNINNFAHVVITEDSDLLLFGCTKVIFKLDLGGNGLLVDQDLLHLAMGVSPGCFSLDRFRQMCILSGCDYLSSLPKIGLGKAFRFIKSTVDPDIHRALSRLGGHLNMSIVVPLEYRDNFVAAEAMFRHQPVFDPLSRRLVPLTPLSSSDPPLALLSDEPLSQQQLVHLAYGNLDPFTLEKVDDWSPDKPQTPSGRSSGWNSKLMAPHKSIWSADYKPCPLVLEGPTGPCDVKRSSTCGRVVEHSVDIPKTAPKRPAPNTEEELQRVRDQFCSTPQPNKKARCEDSDILELLEKTPPKADNAGSEVSESPKTAHANPFSKATPNSANKFSGLAKLAQFRKTQSAGSIVQSRYFGSPSVNKADEIKPDSNTLKDISNFVAISQNPNCYIKPVAKSIEKLSDNSISQLIQEGEEELKDSEQSLTNSNRKENDSGDSVKPNRENSFKWKPIKPSLQDMFGFRSKTLSSSSAVKKDFVNPSRVETKVTQFTPGSSSLASPEQESKVSRRNPFAKVPKTEPLSDSLGSQGMSLSRDSDSDILTPDSCGESPDDEVPLVWSYRTASPSTATPRPQFKVGLSKNIGVCQKSLLSAFSFKAKPKLQR